MKRSYALLAVVVVLAFCLVGCSTGDQTNSGSPGVSSSPSATRPLPAPA